MALGKLNDKTNFPSTFKINKELVSDKSKMADSFNNYFLTILEIVKKLKPKISFCYDEIPTNIAKESIPFTHIINLSLKKELYQINLRLSPYTKYQREIK